MLPAMTQALETSVVRVRGGVATPASDRVAIERPLQIRVRIGDDERALSTTMRTPGDDVALAVGFLHAEGVLADGADLRGAEAIDDDTVRVELGPAAAAALAASARTFVTSAACGVCGRAGLDGLESGGVNRLDADARVTAAVIHGLPGALRAAQATFDSTGGLHAAALFSLDGALLVVHEDVGRHNAVDKLVGRLLLGGRLPVAAGVLMLSGRASFELVQKAEAAGIPIVAAVGAPSSLAIERAAAAGMTLLGFVRDSGFNVYCGAARIVGLTDIGPISRAPDQPPA
jgi:FdhD protein